MSIPAPDLAKLTDEEVWVDLHHGMSDSPMHRPVILTLQPNNLDRQTRRLPRARLRRRQAGERDGEARRLHAQPAHARGFWKNAPTGHREATRYTFPGSGERTTFQTAADVTPWRRLCAPLLLAPDVSGAGGRRGSSVSETGKRMQAATSRGVPGRLSIVPRPSSALNSSNAWPAAVARRTRSTGASWAIVSARSATLIS